MNQFKKGDRVKLGVEGAYIGEVTNVTQRPHPRTQGAKQEIVWVRWNDWANALTYLPESLIKL